MATVEAHPRRQPLRALDAANMSRLAAVAVKRDVKAGRITIGEALQDDRAGPITVLDLLMSQRRWGRERAVKLLASASVANRISETKRVRELTDRQKALLAAWCES